MLLLYNRKSTKAGHRVTDYIVGRDDIFIYSMQGVYLAAALLTLLMIITEYLEIKVDFLETFIAGKAVIVIENGTPNIKNLKKLRMSIDKLETRLRQAGVASIEDVKYATIEVSGQLGYELKDNKKPLTKEDFSELMAEISRVKHMISSGNKSEP